MLMCLLHLAGQQRAVRGRDPRAREDLEYPRALVCYCMYYVCLCLYFCVVYCFVCTLMLLLIIELIVALDFVVSFTDATALVLSASRPSPAYPSPPAAEPRTASKTRPL